MSSQPADDINDYLDGLLSREDRAAFEAALSRSVKLRKQLALERQIRATLVQRAKDDHLRGMIRAAREQHQPTAEIISRPRGSGRWLVAAAALLLLIGSVWFFLPSPAPDTAALAEYYGSLNHPAGILPVSTLRSDDYARRKSTFSATEDTFTGAEPLFETIYRARALTARDSFSSALEAYLAIPDDALTDSLTFEVALIHLQLNQARAALTLLDGLPEAPFRGGPYWYRAMAYLQLGEADSARVQLQALVAEFRRPYRKHALELLEELKR